MAATIALPAGVSARPRPRFEPTDLEWEETGVAEVDLRVRRHPQPRPVALRDPRLRARLRHPPQRRAGPGRRLRRRRPGLRCVRVRPRGARQPVAVAEDRDLGRSRLRDAPRAGDRDPDRAQAAGRPPARTASAPRACSWSSAAAVARRERRCSTWAGSSSRRRTGSAYRQIGVETGVDLQVQLDSQNRFQWTGELATAYFISPDPNQLHATTGITWSAIPEPRPFGGRRVRLPGGRRPLRRPVRHRAETAHVRGGAA